MAKSTKKPLPKKRKIAEKSKEDVMLYQAMSVLAKSNKEPDDDDAFGQNIALTLKSIPEKRTKEFIKFKIQELLFQAQFGNLVMPLNVVQHHGQRISPNQINMVSTNQYRQSPVLVKSPLGSPTTHFYQYSQSTHDNVPSNEDDTSETFSYKL